MCEKASFFAPLLLVGTGLQTDLHINVSDGIIESLSPEAAYPTEIVDLGEQALVYPGCTNTHSHAFQSLFRGANNDFKLMDWLTNLYQNIENCTPDDIYRGAKWSFEEMVLNGITSVSEFFYVNGQGNENARQVIKAAQDVGLRLDFHRAIIDAEKLSPTFREDPDSGMARYRELNAEFEDSDALKIGLAAHSIYYSSQDVLEAVNDQAVNEEKKWHMHYSDSLATKEIAEKMYGKSETRHLYDTDLLNHHFVGIHAIWADAEDIDLLADKGAQVSHNPISNRFIGEPLPDVVTMLQKGVNVGLGTDGPASSPSLSILAETKHAAIGQKSAHRDPTVLKTEEALKLATVNGANITGFKSGLLAPGYFADFVVCNTTHPSLQPVQNALSHFVYSVSPQAIEKVAVGGHFIVNGDGCEVKRDRARMYP